MHRYRRIICERPLKWIKVHRKIRNAREYPYIDVDIVFYLQREFFLKLGEINNNVINNLKSWSKQDEPVHEISNNVAF